MAGSVPLLVDNKVSISESGSFVLLYMIVNNVKCFKYLELIDVLFFILQAQKRKQCG